MMAKTEIPVPRPDPRLEGATSKYDRNDVVAQIESFYAFLPHIPTAAVHKAPAGGWQSITSETRGLENKTPEVVELLRRLPYIDGSVNKHPWIAHEAYPCDYRVLAREDISPRDTPGWVIDVRQDAGFVTDRGVERKVRAEEETWPPWVVQLTTGTDREGQCLMLDTTDGTVTMYCVMRYLYEPTYSSDDPRAWRDRMCDYETRTLTDQLEEWRREYRNLFFVGLPNVNEGNYVSLLYDGEQQTEVAFKKVRSIYRENGWPDNYEKKACHEALERWWPTRNK
ncbi:hypothetical protein E0Z10_g7209 [Xylaria hypoxylon]|uniref:Uncharacterized protein n=1 Tax=Xylaria hypoxylon TaxID=37992 RepID=A0A4Z0YVS4_9PEZI|nr:hypothetical protein E0Z10_g7209 [Xylaria hypoxylon]